MGINAELVNMVASMRHAGVMKGTSIDKAGRTQTTTGFLKRLLGGWK